MERRMCNAMEVNLKNLMHAMVGALPCYATDGMDAYIRYCVRHDIMQALLCPWRPVLYVIHTRPSQAQGVRLRARLVGPQSHTWAMCGKLPCIHPRPDKARA